MCKVEIVPKLICHKNAEMLLEFIFNLKFIFNEQGLSNCCGMNYSSVKDGYHCVNPVQPRAMLGGIKTS